MLVTVSTANGLGSGGVLFIGRRRRYIFVIYLLGLFSVIFMFFNKDFFYRDDLHAKEILVYTVKKKRYNKGQLFSSY